MLFTIPVVIDIHGHRFEVFTFMSEIHENVDLVLGIKNIFELKGVVNLREACSVFNRSVLFFLKEQVILKPKEQRFIKIEAPVVDEISDLVIIMLKLKFIQNMATLDMINNSSDTVIFDPKEMLQILDLRLIGYYKIRQGTLQQNLCKYYRFESVDILSEQFNNFVNTIKKEKEETREKYPWLEQDDKRKNITVKEILDKSINLDKSCPSDAKNKQVQERQESFS